MNGAGGRLLATVLLPLLLLLTTSVATSSSDIHPDVRTMFGLMDNNGDGLCDTLEAADYWVRNGACDPDEVDSSSTVLSAVRPALDLVDSDGDGKMSIDELQAVAGRLGSSVLHGHNDVQQVHLTLVRGNHTQLQVIFATVGGSKVS